MDILRRAGVETLMASVMDSLMIDSSRHIKGSKLIVNDVEYAYTYNHGDPAYVSKDEDVIFYVRIRT